MTMKRVREGREDVARPSAKRTKVNTDLAKTWDQLADEDEEFRLEAASDLLENHLSTQDVETARTVAKRLFRGLCSSRKAARLGFYVALVGSLSMNPGPFGLQEARLDEILSILEDQTRPESGISGQDERDHSFGRLMGCKAVLDSNVLLTLNKDHTTEYDQISKLLAILMAERPWLRPEITSTLVTALQDMARIDKPDTIRASKFATSLFRQLKDHKVLRTIDGVGLWLLVKEQLPSTEFPRDTWTKNDPLNVKDVEDLKRVLLDRQGKVTDEDEILGNSVWSPTLHPAWYVMLDDLVTSKGKNRVSFAQFWQVIVENGYFQPSSTPERKRTGFLILQATIGKVNEEDIATCFSPNLAATLIHSLIKKQETYLFNTANTVLSHIQAHLASAETSRGDCVILGLIQGSSYIDFDVVTKTTVLNDLMCSLGVDQNKAIAKLLSWVEIPPLVTGNESETELTRKNLLNICQRAIYHTIRTAVEEEDPVLQNRLWDWVLRIAQHFLTMKHDAIAGEIKPPFQQTTTEFLKDKIAGVMETLLTGGVPGQQIILRLPTVLKNSRLGAEEAIQTIVEQCWVTLEKLSGRAFQPNTEQTNGTSSRDKTRRRKRMTVPEGLAIMFALLLQEAYEGDGNSVEILEDILSVSEKYLTTGDVTDTAENITEVVLSLASRSSKLFRRAGALIFEAFSSHIPSKGLQSLCDILCSNENREGQQELFEADGGDYDEDSAEEVEGKSEDGASDPESLDSDVEMIGNKEANEEANARNDDTGTDSATGSDTASNFDSEADPDDQTEELVNFETALAKALGTRKLNQDDLMDMDHESESSDSSDSDADMSDSEMVQLDEKLAEIFKNQQSQLSVQRARREELRSAKEIVVNLKNRALDLVEVFLRSEQKRGIECAQLLSATFQMASTTNSQQLTTRGIDIITAFIRKCRGSKLPIVKRDDATRSCLRSNLATLHTILLSSGQPSKLSNALIETASSLNVLFCRLVVAAGCKNVANVINEVSKSREYSDIDGRASVAKFWSQYDQWLDLQAEQPKSESNLKSITGIKPNGNSTKSIPATETVNGKKGKKEKRKSRSK